MHLGLDGRESFLRGQDRGTAGLRKTMRKAEGFRCSYIKQNKALRQRPKASDKDKSFFRIFISLQIFNDISLFVSTMGYEDEPFPQPTFSFFFMNMMF